MLLAKYLKVTLAPQAKIRRTSFARPRKRGSRQPLAGTNLFIHCKKMNEMLAFHSWGCCFATPPYFCIKYIWNISIFCYIIKFFKYIFFTVGCLFKVIFHSYYVRQRSKPFAYFYIRTYRAAAPVQALFLLTFL